VTQLRSAASRASRLESELSNCLAGLDLHRDEYQYDGNATERWQSDIDSWQALVKLYCKLDFVDIDDVWAAALAVYGWMPRALRTVRQPLELQGLAREIRATAGAYNTGRASFDVALARRCLDILRKAHSCSEVLTALETTSRPRSDGGGTISSVGVSKFLHFLAPHVLPIWDSRTARALHVTDHYPADRFLEYVVVLHTALANGLRAPSFVVDLLDRGGGIKSSDVRALEFTLYMCGKPRPRLETA
jgi:hypothetical protein